MVPDTQQQKARRSRVDQLIQNVVAQVKFTVCELMREGFIPSSGRFAWCT